MFAQGKPPQAPTSTLVGADTLPSTEGTSSDEMHGKRRKAIPRKPNWTVEEKRVFIQLYLYYMPPVRLHGLCPLLWAFVMLRWDSRVFMMHHSSARRQTASGR